MSADVKTGFLDLTTVSALLSLVDYSKLMEFNPSLPKPKILL